MILVTGASGFVGAHITERLSKNGAAVRAIYHSCKPDAAMVGWQGVEWQYADLLDVYDVEEVMKGITEVYHCAAIVSFNPARREEIIHTNTEITHNVVNAVIASGVRKMLYLSSVAALGRNGASKEISEDAQWEESGLNSSYGLSKQLAEMEVWRGIGEGMEAAILNPGIILGEPINSNGSGWTDGSARLMHVAYKEFPYYTDGITAFVDVKDVVKAAIELMGSEVSAERFILSEGNHPFREIFTLMAKALGRKRPYIHANTLMTSLVWRASAIKARVSGTRTALTKETARNAQTKSYYKADKIQEVVPGYIYTPIQDTITRVAKAYLTQLA